EETRSHRQHRGPDDLGDLARSDALELVKHEDDALLVGQAVEQPAERADALSTLGVLVGAGLTALGQHLAERRGGEDGPAAGGPAVHEDDVDRDAMQPGAELGLAAEVFEAPVDLDEHFLDDVLEVSPAAEHAVHEAGDIGAVTVVELAERGPIVR